MEYTTLFNRCHAVTSRKIMKFQPSEILIKPQRTSPRAPTSAGSRVEQGIFRSEATAFPCATFFPLHYTQSYAYPLIVWFHSPGQSETQLLRVMPLLSLRNFAAVALRGIEERNRDGQIKPGYYWTSESYTDVYEAVLETLENVQSKCHIAPNRICFAGCEEGGTMAQRLAFRNPSLCSSVISINGSVPEDGMLLENLNEMRKLRFLYCCSENSKTRNPDTLYPNLKLMHSAGLQISLRKYTATANFQLETLRDINRWLMMDIATTIM